MKLNYDYRTDGMFLVKTYCPSCEEYYDGIAAAPWTPYCPACMAVREMKEADFEQ